MIKVFMPSHKENVQPLNIGVPVHLHLPRPTSVHTHPAPTQRDSQPCGRFLTFTFRALFHRFLEYSCNILLPLLSLANSSFKTEFSSNLPSLWRPSLIFPDTLIQLRLHALLLLSCCMQVNLFLPPADYDLFASTISVHAHIHPSIHHIFLKFINSQNLVQGLSQKRCSINMV